MVIIQIWVPSCHPFDGARNPGIGKDALDLGDPTSRNSEMGNRLGQGTLGESFISASY